MMSGEFPQFPPGNFDQFVVTPFPTLMTEGKPWTAKLRLENFSKFGILFKVKCTSNQRIKILHCADILASNEETSVELQHNGSEPEKADQLCVVYTLVGDHYFQGKNRNPYVAWQRATSGVIPVRSIIINCVQTSIN